MTLDEKVSIHQLNALGMRVESTVPPSSRLTHDFRITVDGVEVIGGRLDGAPAGQALKQAWLVVLDPHQQRVAGRGRGGEGFFGSAGRRP